MFCISKVSYKVMDEVKQQYIILSYVVITER